MYSASGTDDIDRLCAALNQSGWQAELLQLGAGSLGHRAERVRLPGLGVEFMRYGQALEFREIKADELVTLSLVLEASAPPRLRGFEVGAHHLVVRTAGDESEYVTAAETRSLNFDVAPEHLGGYRGPSRIVAMRGAEPLRRELIAASRALVEACRTDHARPAAAGEKRRELAQARLLGALRALSARGLPPEAISATDLGRFQLVERARGHLRETRGSVPIPKLARELAVSERTLFRAFRQSLGMGPREVDQLRRLHEVRAMLLARGPGRGRVAEAAAEAGFTHLGRLADLYRRHFGELPTQTLARRA